MKVLMLLLFPFLTVHAQSSFDKKIDNAAATLKCEAPGEATPVTVNAQLVEYNDSVAVIIKVNMQPGWHIYEFVPTTLPYIALERLLELPEGYVAVGKWKKPRPDTYANDPGVLIYENEVVFIRKIFKANAVTGVIKAGLYYQTCNLRQCLPPVEKLFELHL